MPCVLVVYAMRMAAVFMIVVSTMGVRLGILPRWLVGGGYGGALMLILNVSYIELVILVFPAWAAAVSVVILTAQPHPRRESTRARSGGGGSSHRSDDSSPVPGDADAP